MHKKLSVQNRLENALCAFTLLDLGHMLALEKEKDLGCKPGKCFLDPITIRNMKDLAGCVAIQSVALPDGYHFRPHGMTELPSEQNFGMLRKQFSSAQMSTRDYIRASARCAEQYVRKLRNSGSSDVRSPVDEDKQHWNWWLFAVTTQSLSWNGHMLHLHRTDQCWQNWRILGYHKIRIFLESKDLLNIFVFCRY